MQTIAADVTGSPPLAFKWRVDGRLIVGAATATLQLSSLLASQAGAYTLTVTNTLVNVAVTSSPVVVSVLMC